MLLLVHMFYCCYRCAPAGAYVQQLIACKYVLLLVAGSYVLLAVGPFHMLLKYMCYYPVEGTYLILLVLMCSCCYVPATYILLLVAVAYVYICAVCSCWEPVNMLLVWHTSNTYALQQVAGTYVLLLLHTSNTCPTAGT